MSVRNSTENLTLGLKKKGSQSSKGARPFENDNSNTQARNMMIQKLTIEGLDIEKKNSDDKFNAP